ncbi:TRAF-type zinc finger domain-containing protein 1 isoform X2 [Rhinoderma darwinii]
MASSAEQETRLCGNCKRDIPLVNFTIHEIHCRRNISMCKLCKEPIPRSDMEDHYASEHAPVTCKCNMTMEKCALEEHEKSSCPLRLVTCQFCELEVTFNSLENHEDYCGARTELCEKCGSSVMIKDLKDHPTVCGKVKPPKEPVRIHNWVDSRDYEVPLLTALTSRSAFTDHLNSRHVPQRFYGKSMLTQSLKTFDHLNQNTRRDQNRGNERANLDMDSPLNLLNPCLEEKPKTFRNYDFFRSQSRPNTQSVLEPDVPFTETGQDFWRDSYCKDNEMKTNVRGRSNINYFSNNESMQLSSSSTPTTDAIQLPCEFCEELFPELDLILHQSGCRPSAFTFVRRPSPSPPLDFTENLRSSSPPAHISQSVIIPCEFCGVLMEGDILFHHQDQCDMGSNSEKTPPFSNSFTDVSPAEDEYRSCVVPATSQLQAPESDTTVSTRNQTRGNADNTTRGHGRIESLYCPINNTRHSNLEEMRIRNIEENTRRVRSQHEDFYGLTQGASTRDTDTRSKPKKKINTRSEEVGKEE